MSGLQYAGLLLTISFWGIAILRHLRQVCTNQVAIARILVKEKA